MPAITGELAPILDDFLCPITRDVFEDPVLTCDGQSYERAAIEEFFRRRQRNEQTGVLEPPRSPLTNQVLATIELTPNIALRKAIDTYMQMRPELRREKPMMALEDVRAAVDAVEADALAAKSRAAPSLTADDVDSLTDELDETKDRLRALQDEFDVVLADKQWFKELARGGGKKIIRIYTEVHWTELSEVHWSRFDSLYQAIEFDLACLGEPSLPGEERLRRARLHAKALLDELVSDGDVQRCSVVFSFKRERPAGNGEFWGEMDVITDFSVVEPLNDGDYVGCEFVRR